MKIHGFEPTEAQIEACLKRMKESPFTTRELTDFAITLGVPLWHHCKPAALRFADTLIRREREHLSYQDHNKWVWNR